MSAPTPKPTRRILLPVGEKEYQSTGGRLLALAGRVADAGDHVDVLTCHEAIHDKAAEQYARHERIRVLLVKPEDRFWTMAQRDNFAKTFIKLTHDLVIPDTDMKFWKMVGFDDFLWNVSAVVFPKITESYDLVLLPIPSQSEHPSNTQDVFYTNVLYYAKERRVPVAGLQIYQIADLPPIFPKILDYFVVKSPDEQAYFIDSGIPPDRVALLDDLKDRYCLDTIEDPYMQHVFDKDIAIPKDRLGVVIVNHVKNRQQLKDIFEAVGALGVPTTVFFVFLNFAVKELHENDIFQDLMRPALEQAVGAFYSVESGGFVRALMLGDVTVATDYMLQLSFGARYGKVGVVYNPLRERVDHIKEVAFAGSRQALRQVLLDAYERKRRRVTLADVVGRILS